jgi:hypothetical protein
MTVDAAGHIVVVDTANDALRRVSKAGAGGAVRTLAGSGEAGFADGQGASTIQRAWRGTRTGAFWWPTRATTRCGG